MKAEEVGGETEGDFTDHCNELGKFHKRTKNLAYQGTLSTTICGAAEHLNFILFSWAQRIRTIGIGIMKF